MQGLNTEVDPTLLGQKGAEGGFSRFLRVTLQGGILRPVPSDATHSNPTFTEQQLGTSVVSEPFSVRSLQGFRAYVAQAGGAPMLRNQFGTTAPLALPAPTVAPGISGLTFNYSMTSGDVRYYVSRWLDEATPEVSYGFSGLSPVATAGPYDLAVLFVAADISGAAPLGGLTGTAATIYSGTDGSAVCVDSWTGTGLGQHYILVKDPSGDFAGSAALTWGSGTTAGTVTLTSAYGLNDGFRRLMIPLKAAYPAVGNTVTSSSGGTATCANLNTAYGGTTALFRNLYLHDATGSFHTGDTIRWGTSETQCTYAGVAGVAPTLTVPEAYPDGVAGWQSYVLDDTGTYRSLSGTLDNTYAEQWPTLTAYDGPLDTAGLPETLVVPGTCQTLCVHKGCVFLGEGNLVRWSEGMLTGIEARWFRDGYTLDAGGEVWRLVSRNEVLEIFTASGIKYVVGNPPYFEIRDTQVTERAISRGSIVPTDRGTFYHGGDGLRLLSGQSSRLVSNGWNRPWFDAIEDPEQTVAGASLGRYVICDATGRALVWDWESEEWMERTFAEQPGGFVWNDESRCLVAKVGGAYLEIERGTQAVSWEVGYPTRGGGKNLPLPGFVWLDNTGPVVLDVYIDGELYESLPVTDDSQGRVRLPNARGYSWSLVVRGVGTPTTSRVRSLR